MFIPFNKQQKCHVTNIYTVEEKQKYHIKSPSSKLSWKSFLAAFVILIESFYLIASKGK